LTVSPRTQGKFSVTPATENYYCQLPNQTRSAPRALSSPTSDRTSYSGLPAQGPVRPFYPGPSSARTFAGRSPVSPVLALTREQATSPRPPQRGAVGGMHTRRSRRTHHCYGLLYCGPGQLASHPAPALGVTRGAFHFARAATRCAVTRTQLWLCASQPLRSHPDSAPPSPPSQEVSSWLRYQHGPRTAFDRPVKLHYNARSRRV